jgi:hypothetical protein
MPKGLLIQFLRLLVGRRSLPFFSSPVAPPVQAIEPAEQQLAPLGPTVDPVTPVEAPLPSGNDIIITDDKDEATPLPFPTPAVIEITENALADASAPTAASAFTLGCGAFKRRDARLSRAPWLSSPTPAVDPRADLQRLRFTRARTACPRRLRLRRVPPLFAASSPSGCRFPSHCRAAAKATPAVEARSRWDSRTVARLAPTPPSTTSTKWRMGSSASHR